MSSIGRHVDFKSDPLMLGEQSISNTAIATQEVMSQQSGRSSTRTPAASQRARNARLIMTLSVANFVVAAILLTWTLLDRYDAAPTSGSSSEQPSVVSQQPTAVPTDVAVVVVEATASLTPTLIPPSRTPEPPIPTNTQQTEPPTATLEPPTATPELPTATPEPPTQTPAPPTDTPEPPPPAATDTPVPAPLPTTARPRPRPTKTPIREIVYIVRFGDNLTGIAYKYRTTVNAIMRRNGLYSTVIYTGQRLIIPLR